MCSVAREVQRGAQGGFCTLGEAANLEPNMDMFALHAILRLCMRYALLRDHFMHLSSDTLE